MLGACKCMFGSATTLLRATANEDAPDAAVDITFSYTDYVCGGQSRRMPSFRTPVFINAPPGWDGIITTVSARTWHVTKVPWAMTAVFALGVCDGGTARTSTTIRVQVCVPAPACAGARVSAQWNQDASGCTCVQFEWQTRSRFVRFEYTLTNERTSAVVVNDTCMAAARALLITNLDPDTTYVFELFGVCADGSRHAALPVTGTTTPAPNLSPAYTIIDAVPSEGQGEPPTLVDLTVQYDEYAHATNIQATVANPPDGWAGSITLISTEPIQWLVTQIPYDSVLALVVTADYVNCECTPADDTIVVVAAERAPRARGARGVRTALPSGDVSLRVTLTIDVGSPVPAGDPCPTLSLNETYDATPTTFTVYWTTNSQFTGGYSYNVYTAVYPPKLITQGIVANFNTTHVTVGSNDPTLLTPGTTYQFNASGMCGGMIGPESSLGITMASSCTGMLGPIDSSMITFITGTTTGTYTAVLTYSDYMNLTGSPTLTITNITPSPHVTYSGGKWSMPNLTPGATVSIELTGEPRAGCTPPPPVSTTFKVPSVYPGCVTQPLVVQVLGQPSSTCVTLSWTPTASFARGYTYTLKTQSSTQTGACVNGTSSLQLTGLTASTEYTFELVGKCTPKQSSQPATVTFTTADVSVPTLAPFTPSASTVTYMFESDGTVVATITYSKTLQTCVCNVTCTSSPAASSVVNTNPTFVLKGLTANTTYECTISADAAPTTACSACASGPAPTPQTFSITTPDTPPPPPPTSTLFELIITNYGGPPSRVLSSGKIEALSLTAPALFGVNISLTPVPSAGSWAAQHSMLETYSTNVVTGFIKAHTQTQRTINGHTFYLPITQLFFGNAIDPCVQGASIPASIGHGTYSAFLPYNYANSYYTAAGEADTDVPPPVPVLPPESFQFPPFLEYFRQLAVYNWEVENGVYANSNGRVAMALNNYGSKKWGEEWWFSCVIDDDGLIQTGGPTSSPTNPKLQPSVVDGSANDGNIPAPPPGSDMPGAGLSGWNCMERWFMHAAYCNQQLRFIIQNGLIQGAAASAMTLNNLNSTNAQYYQISAITTDGEGNGFPNTLYNEPGVCYIPDLVPTPAECNYTMKALWNKWMNQSTSLPSTPPAWWSSAATSGGMVAPASRVYMGATQFTLPCAMSMTKPNLLPGMSLGDVGNPDYDAVSAVMIEVYDTSDAAPFCMLGADETPVNACPATTPATTVQGAQFTAQQYSDANPTSTADMYAINPNKFTQTYGVWDNLVLTGKTCTPALNVVYTEGAAPNCSLVSEAGATGSLTAFNDASQAFSPLMNTSIFTPWSHGSTQEWVVQPADAAPTTPPFHNDETNGDGACLGWALEASRYDLYNGAWAAAAQRAASLQITDYTAVVQGENGADGALLWYDLSTGLKCRVVAALAPASDSISTPAAAAGQVWMLSNQCGPWVNCLSVRAAVRGDLEAVITSADTLTFTCPDSALSKEPMPEGAWPGWPGWTGMAGQPWGAFHEAPNVTMPWSLDQAWLGPCDPLAPGTSTTTGSTEDNFGVFYDFNIQIAAWLAMALDLQGLGPTCPPAGISANAAIKYTPTTTGVPKIGCYELAFMPLSWFGSLVVPTD